ncbi:condensation domain-containing protein [Streptomyces sp. NPDC049813]|uniref:phthiocerol/phthiodiolone dimycocerosyl transferase family protein n=1 Tax=Streptomyces sp. NPDC049813 TaxID=3365597 RepID=UPI0037A489C9
MPATTAPPAAQQRALSASESALAATGTPLIISHRLHGPLDRAALARAVDDLTRQHPVLTCRITHQDRDQNQNQDQDQDQGGKEVAYLRHDPRLPAPHLTEHTDFETATAPFPADAPLFRVTLLTESADRHQVVLAVAHALSDGTSCLALFNELWTRYTVHATSSDPELPSPAAPLPLAVEDHFRARFSAQDITDFLAELRTTATTAPAPERLPAQAATEDGPDPGTGSHLRHLHLDPTQTQHFTRTAAEARTTPHAVLCGLALLAVRDQLTSQDRAVRDQLTPQDRAVRDQLTPQDRAVRLGCLTPVDLRPRMAPALPRDHLVFAAATTEAVLDVHPEDTPVDLGRQVWHQLRAALTDGRLDRAIAALPQLMHEIAAAPMSIVVSSLGARARTFPLPPGLTAEPLWGYSPPPGPLPALFSVGTPDGGLTLLLVLPRAWYTPEQAQGLADGLGHHLRQLVETPPQTRVPRTPASPGAGAA